MGYITVYQAAKILNEERERFGLKRISAAAFAELVVEGQPPFKTSKGEHNNTIIDEESFKAWVIAANEKAMRDTMVPRPTRPLSQLEADRRLAIRTTANLAHLGQAQKDQFSEEDHASLERARTVLLRFLNTTDGV